VVAALTLCLSMGQHVDSNEVMHHIALYIGIRSTTHKVFDVLLLLFKFVD
jgi:hypothetical protein